MTLRRAALLSSVPYTPVRLNHFYASGIFIQGKPIVTVRGFNASFLVSLLTERFEKPILSGGN